MTADLVVAPGATWAQLAGAVRRLLSDPDAAALLATSGSSGTPKRVRLSGAALRASGQASEARLGGPGQWLLALPTQHVAGFQVVVRSVLAGRDPVALEPGPFSVATFAAAVSAMAPGARRYASLVPTQLQRVLADPAGQRAAARLDAVLLGGAAADPALLSRATGAGVPVVTSYGMSETAGGCVYDGMPLDGVQVRVEPGSGRIWLGGDVLADGYADDPALTAERFQVSGRQRWFVTADRGALDDRGRLRVLGRLDGVIVSGGHKVEPTEVEAALRELPQVADAVVVGVPDEQWGEVVAAVVVAQGPTGPPIPVQTLRDWLRPVLPSHALPRVLTWANAIPMLVSGKPDRRAARALAGGGSPGAAPEVSGGTMGGHTPTGGTE